MDILPDKSQSRPIYFRESMGNRAVPVRPADDALSIIDTMAMEAGLIFGVYPVRHFKNSYMFLLDRKEAGLNGSMQFTYRNPLRSTSPERIFDGAKSIVTFALPIARHESKEELILPNLLARYARRDYYGILRNDLEKIKSSLNAIGVRSKVVLDSNELVDKEVAVRSGIGSYLKNSLVNVPGIGSATILGNLVVDIALPRIGAPDRLISCGRCRICIDSCPTGAIGEDGAIDARRCISWILQAPEDIDEVFLPRIGVRLYGCDICQDVCPINRIKVRTRSEVTKSIDDTAVEILTVFNSSDDEILGLLPHIYIYRRDVRLVRRNCIIAAANLGKGSSYDSEIVEAVYRLCHSDSYYDSYAKYFFASRCDD